MFCPHFLNAYFTVEKYPSQYLTPLKQPGVHGVRPGVRNVYGRTCSTPGVRKVRPAVLEVRPGGCGVHPPVHQKSRGHIITTLLVCLSSFVVSFMHSLWV